MELGTIILTLIVITACFVPFVYISGSNRKKQKQVLKRLLDLAAKFNTEIVQYDNWYNGMIGADEGLQQIFFTKKIGGVEVDQHVLLSEVKDCKIMKIDRNINTREGDIKVTDKLELVFGYKDKQKADTSLIFYDEKTDNLMLAGELQLINKWNDLVNDRLKSFG